MNNYKVPNYYAVVDFECTAREIRKDWLFEIIEFPVIFLNAETLKVEFTFHRYVKPIINPILTEFCTNLTGITQEQVDESNQLHVVLQELEAFLAEKNLVLLSQDPPEDKLTFVWASDGVFDFHDFLFVECERKNINLPPIFDKILDVRHNFRTHTKKSGNIEVMLQFFNLKFEGREHSGMDDAKNIVRIMVAVLNKFKRMFWETRKQGEARRDRQRKPRLGDWICPDCNETNFSSRDKCFRCNIDRPANIKRVKAGEYQSRRRPRQYRRNEHDWECPACAFSNWASRDACFKCNRAKPPTIQDMDQGASILTGAGDNGVPNMMMPGPGMGMAPGMMNPAMFNPMNFMNPMMMMSPPGGYNPNQFTFPMPPQGAPSSPATSNGGMKSVSEFSNDAESENSHEPQNDGAGTTLNESNANTPGMDPQTGLYTNPAFSPGPGFYGPGSPAGVPPAMSPGGVMMPFMNPMMPPNMMNGMGGFPYAMPAPTQQKQVVRTDEGSEYWICRTCRTHNFHKGSQCHGCGMDWICPVCTFNNYAFRNECLRCRTPKPAEPFQMPLIDPTTPKLPTEQPSKTPPETTAENAV